MKDSSLSLRLREFGAKTKEKFLSFVASMKAYFLGPSVGLANRKIKEKDPNRFVLAVSFCFTIVLFGLVRGWETGANEFGLFFAYPFVHLEALPFFLVSLLCVIFAVISIIVMRKRKFMIVEDAVLSILFPISISYLFYSAKIYPLQQDNWLVWLVMVLPLFVFAFATGVNFSRVIVKWFVSCSNVSEERADDYLFRMRRLSKLDRRAKEWAKHNWGQILVVIALIILAVLVLIPLVFLLMRSFKLGKDDLAYPFDVPARITFDNYSYMWEYLKGAFLNSLLTTLGVTLGTMICASLLGYAFIRFHFPGKSILFYLVIGLMMIPGILTLISRYQEILAMNLSGNLWGIILPGIAGYMPASFMLLYTFFKGIPHDLFEAADIDGANDFSVYLNIVLPLSKPILSTIAIQTFVGEWNDYLWASLVEGDNEAIYTLPVYLFRLSSQYEQAYLGMAAPFAGYVLSAIPLVLIFIVASKQFIEGLTSGAFKM